MKTFNVAKYRKKTYQGRQKNTKKNTKTNKLTYKNHKHRAYSGSTSH